MISVLHISGLCPYFYRVIIHHVYGRCNRVWKKLLKEELEFVEKQPLALPMGELARRKA